MKQEIIGSTDQLKKRKLITTVILIAAIFIFFYGNAHALDVIIGNPEWNTESEATLPNYIGWGCPIGDKIQEYKRRAEAEGGALEWLGYINYFIPLNEFAAMLAAWMVAIGLYYLVSIVLRWMRAVS